MYKENKTMTPFMTKENEKETIRMLLEKVRALEEENSNLKETLEKIKLEVEEEQDDKWYSRDLRNV